MKKFIFSMISLLLLAYVSLFFIKKPDGTPIKTFDSSKVSDVISNVKDTVGEMSQAVSGAKTSMQEMLDVESARRKEEAELPAQYYRWYDGSGIAHYGDVAPAGVKAELVAAAPQNIVPSMVIESLNAEVVVDQPRSERGTVKLPAKIREMHQALEKASAIESQLQNRFEEQDEILRKL